MELGARICEWDQRDQQTLDQVQIRPAPTFIRKQVHLCRLRQSKANSKLVMLASIMAAWTGAGRSITLRTCVQGAGWSGDGEGLRIKTGTTEARQHRSRNVVRLGLQ